MSSQKTFIHLHLHSAYSLAEGALRTKDIIKLCQKNKMPAVAVTDSGNLFGALEFAMAAAKGGVQPIIGCQIKLGLEEHELVLLVQSEKGYRNLCKLVSSSFLESDPTAPAHINWPDLKASSEGLICLSGGAKGPAGQYLIHNQRKQAQEVVKKLKKIFGDRFYIELQRHGLPQEEAIEESLIDLAYKHDIPLVATNDCYFATKDMYEAHDALLCIAGGRYIIEEDRRKETPEHYFKSAAEMQELFSDLPEAIDNTVVIAQRCHYLLKPIDPILPPFETEDGLPEQEEIRKQSKDGLQWRLENFIYEDGLSEEEKKEIAAPYWARLDYELGIIEQMGFPGYFLIVSDFIKWAKDHDIPVGPGRGSGGGSVVAWALKITDLDPLELNLLFERFLNPERVSMPDFDIDFCQERRDEVIRYVQDRYGHDHVAQIITFGKLQARAVVRDVGRVLQLPYGQVDRIAKMIPSNPANPLTLGEALDQDPDLRREIGREETTQKLINIALKLEGLYRHASTHAAGVVIGDRPLHELIPLYRDPRSDMPVTQFNMKYVEQAGLVKFDFLGLKTMTVIHKACEFVKTTHNKEINILEVPFDDDKTFDILKRGQNIGVFQVESAGMRELGKQIGIGNLEELLAVIALYRPGPMENIPVYLDNIKHPEKIDYMHPKLKPITEDTYGVMIYQEQVMQAAQVLAGYSLGGADLLRRAMGKKIQEEMDKQREMFVEGAKKHNDIPPDQANHIFDQIAAFAGYGFNKAHTAGYGLVSYWTGWLKANYPAEFMAASMTLDMGNTDKLSVFKQELDRMGIPLYPPDINKSDVAFTVENGGIRYALAALKGVGAEAMKKLVAERDEKGPYKSLQNLAGRLEARTINRKQLEQLACAGAFESFEPNRARAHGAADLLLRYAQEKQAERESGQVNLFGGGDQAETPLILPEVPEWEMLDKLKREFDAIGFYLSAHPLDAKAAQLERLGIVSCTNIIDQMGGLPNVVMDMAGILIKKQIKVSGRGNKYAFLQLSDSSGVYEVTLFSELLAQKRDELVAGEPFYLKIVAEQRDDQVRLTVQNIAPLEEALSGKVKAVNIRLEPGEALVSETLRTLKHLLDDTASGHSRVMLLYTTAQAGRVKMSLPGGWHITADLRKEVMKLAGVAGFEEL